MPYKFNPFTGNFDEVGGNVESLLTSLAAGSVIFSNGSHLTGDSSTFFWDNTNKRLAIGHASPSVPLHIVDATDPRLIVALNANRFWSIDADDGGVASLNYSKNTGTVTIDINPFVLDNLGDGTFRFFRNTNTVGAVYFDIFKGDGTATVNARIGGNVNSYVALDNGNFIIGGTNAGTNAQKVLGIKNGTPPASSPADTVQVYAEDMNSSSELFVRAEAGSIERLTNLKRITTASFDKTNTTLAGITGLSHHVAAGKSYAFKAVLFYDADATGGHKYAVDGTATATYTIHHIRSIDDATNAFVLTSRKTAMNSSAGQAGSTAGMTIIEGSIVVNAAGTLTIQFAQNAANGTSSILRGSTFELIPIGT